MASSRSGLRVLVVRPSALGDVFRTAPALAALRESMPDARIDCVVPDGYQDALRHHPAIDEVMGFARSVTGATRGGWGLLCHFWSLARTLRQRNYDLVFDLQGLARSSLLTYLTRSPCRVGFSNARELGWLGYNRRHYVDPLLHHVVRLLHLLKAEGIGPSEDARLYTGSDDEQWCTSMMHEQGWSDGVFVCLAPTSQWGCKCWPIDRFIEIARRLVESDVAGGRIAVIFGPGERSVVRPLLDAFPGADSARIAAPATTVGQLMALIRRASLVVSNDSAVAHAAVGFDRPAVCIFGPTDPSLVGPYRRQDMVVRPSVRDGLGSLGFYRQQGNDQTLISQVSVDEVWEKILDQLRTCGSAKGGPSVPTEGMVRAKR